MGLRETLVTVFIRNTVAGVHVNDGIAKGIDDIEREFSGPVNIDELDGDGVVREDIIMDFKLEAGGSGACGGILGEYPDGGTGLAEEAEVRVFGNGLLSGSASNDHGIIRLNAFAMVVLMIVVVIIMVIMVVVMVVMVVVIIFMVGMLMPVVIVIAVLMIMVMVVVIVIMVVMIVVVVVMLIGEDEPFEFAFVGMVEYGEIDFAFIYVNGMMVVVVVMMFVVVVMIIMGEEHRCGEQGACCPDGHQGGMFF